MAYLRGTFPDYPERILQHNLEQVQARLQFMAEDDQDPATYNDAYFQRRNPVACEGLVQLTMGAPCLITMGACWWDSCAILTACGSGRACARRGCAGIKLERERV